MPAKSVLIELYVNYIIDEDDLDEVGINEIIRDMYQDASGEINIDGKRYNIEEGKVKNYGTT
jgi:hypothetical protein